MQQELNLVESKELSLEEMLSVLNKEYDKNKKNIFSGSNIKKMLNISDFKFIYHLSSFLKENGWVTKTRVGYIKDKLKSNEYLLKMNSYLSVLNKEFNRENNFFSIKDIMLTLQIKRQTLNTNFLPFLKRNGWMSKNTYGYAPQKYFEEKAISKSKNNSIKSHETFNHAEVELAMVEKPTEEMIKKDLAFAQDMYYNHIRTLFDDIRAASDNPALEKFRDEIETFSKNTQQHLIKVIERL